MKTPEQVAAETAKKIVPILVNDSYLSYREDAAKLILTALTEYAAQVERERDEAMASLRKAHKKWDELLARNDAQYAELTALRTRVADLESQLNDAREYGARMRRERDDWKEVAGQHCADAAKLEQQLHALRLVCGTTDANKFETALDRANTKIKELEARILSDNKAYGCELRDPNGTIWEYAETLKKRVAELELQTFDIKKLEADKARLDAGLTKLYDELEGYEDGAPDAGPKSRLANACLPTIRSLLAIVSASTVAQPAANTGDNHRTEDKL